MSQYTVLPEDGIGPGGDIVFRKHGVGYLLYVGDKQFGIVGHVGTSWHVPNWHAVSFNEKSEFYNIRWMDGFGTRMNAAQFIIRHHGYWMQSEREFRKIWEDQ